MYTEKANSKLEKKKEVNVINKEWTIRISDS